ncbi:hypothetical protein JW897_21745 [Chromobacterium alkanivorans]|uniref:hypothetical protein n=1 Tax=Chromobacterium alkanivorans TaxID=1071719 RepID=UPI0019687F35|nr:hypothetical protein [Chromobacterium alkanivorans]MBN3006370.1 hypothetical protein [Chromobacterium alkanivorans]
MFDIRPYIKPLAIAAVVVLVWGGGYYSGQQVAASAAAARLQSVQLAHEQERSRTATAKADELAAALADQRQLAEQANKLGWKLLQTQGQLAQSQAQLRERITDATRNDGQAWTGLGPDSLRVYRAALGYTESGVSAADTGDAAKAGQAAAADAGIPPADLIAHAVDYGRWCQELEAKFDAHAALQGGH